MSYSVIVTESNASILVDEGGKYSSSLDAIRAVIRAAKDVDIVSITINGIAYDIMDPFTGGLLQDSKIIYLTTGILEADKGLLSRIKSYVVELISSQNAHHSYRRLNRSGKRAAKSVSVVNADFNGPFDVRAEPFSHLSLQRRMHK